MENVQHLPVMEQPICHFTEVFALADIGICKLF